MIHSKKAVGNQENQLFKAELEKFRPFQVRLLQANHKQSSIFKELTSVYSELLQDKRVRAEQNKYDTLARQRGSVLNRYRKVHQAFSDLRAGLERAQKFYADMKNTIDSQSLNVDSFVGNRKSEGGELLQSIERKKTASSNGQANSDTERMQALMGRMSVTSPPPPPSQQAGRPDLGHRPPPAPPQSGYPGIPANTYSTPAPHPMQSPSYGVVPPTRQQASITSPPYQSTPGSHPGHQIPYNPSNYGPMSPPAQPPHAGSGYMSPGLQQYAQTPFQGQGGYGVPPPPPNTSRPQTFSVPPNGQQYGGQQTKNYGQQPQQNNAADPWAGLGGWK